MTTSIDTSRPPVDGPDSREPADRAAFFRQHGYLVLRGVYTGPALADLQRRAHALRDRAVREQPDGMRYWYGRSCQPPAIPSHLDARRYSWGINEITRPDLVDPVLIGSFSQQPLLAVLEAILDRPRAWGLKALWAPQDSTYDLGWHRDLEHALDPCVAYKPTANDHLQYNAAMEADESFIVVPGSHRRPLSDAERAIITEQRTGALPGQVRIRLQPGDIVLMDAHAIHRGQAEAGAPRLSLHYSFQAQWVPLKPWGKPEHFAWITSDSFIGQLPPPARPFYDRLRTAERVGEAQAWLAEHARRQGWDGSGGDRWPGRRRRMG